MLWVWVVYSLLGVPTALYGFLFLSDCVEGSYRDGSHAVRWAHITLDHRRGPRIQCPQCSPPSPLNFLSPPHDDRSVSYCIKTVWKCVSLISSQTAPWSDIIPPGSIITQMYIHNKKTLCVFVHEEVCVYVCVCATLSNTELYVYISPSAACYGLISHVDFERWLWFGQCTITTISVTDK